MSQWADVACFMKPLNKLMYMGKLMVFVLLAMSSSFADVLGTKGNLLFDVQSDQQAEMTLNTTGLGIGTSPSANLHINGNAIISNQLSVGGSEGSSNLNINGTIGYGIQMVSSDATLGDSSIVLVDSSSDNISLILPYAGNVAGRVYTIKKTSLLNSVWISGAGNLIDESSPIELMSSISSLAYVKVISDGQQWYMFDSENISAAIAADNLIGWWRFDESAGNLASDSSPNNYDATLSSLDFAIDGQAGKFNRSLRLSSTSDSINAGDIDEIDNASEITLSAWIKMSATTGDDAIIHKGSAWGTDVAQILMWRDDVGGTSGRTNTISVYVADGDSNTRIEGTSNKVNDTTLWHHAVMTYKPNSANGMRLYIDGVEDANSPVSTATITSIANADALRIGSSVNTSAVLNGDIDDVRIYSKILTPAEIEALYQQGL